MGECGYSIRARAMLCACNSDFAVRESMPRMADDEEVEATTRRVSSGDTRCRHMLLNNVKAQDILPPSCKVFTMKKFTAVSQGLVGAPDDAAQPGADVLDEELAFVQHYKHGHGHGHGHGLNAKVCEWYTYEHTPGLREGEL